MKEHVKKNTLISLVPLLLFAIFTICILIILLSGADIYNKITLRDQNTYQNQTVSQYLSTRLRQGDAEGGVFVGSFEDPVPEESGDTLYLREELDGRIFYTRIYCREGYLCELFTAEELSFQPQDGAKILEINALQFTLQENLLQIEIEYRDSTTETLLLHIRSGKERQS